MVTMAEASRNQDGELDSESLKLSMAAFKAVLARHMKEYVGDRVVTSYTPDAKRVLTLAQKAKPPYILIGTRSITLIKDRTNVVAMSKAGITRPKAYRMKGEIKDAQGEHPRWIDEVKVFPVQIELSVTYVDSDVERMTEAGMKMLLHGMLRAFSFSAVYMGYRTEISVRPQDPPTLSAQDVDWIDMESEDSPGLQSFSIPFTMWTNLFVFGKVPVVQKLIFDLHAGLRDEEPSADSLQVEITQVG